MKHEAVAANNKTRRPVGNPTSDSWRIRRAEGRSQCVHAAGAIRVGFTPAEEPSFSHAVDWHSVGTS
jgi:hypothetical protein